MRPENGDPCSPVHRPEEDAFFETIDVDEIETNFDDDDDINLCEELAMEPLGVDPRTLDVSGEGDVYYPANTSVPTPPLLSPFGRSPPCAHPQDLAGRREWAMAPQRSASPELLEEAFPQLGAVMNASVTMAPTVHADMPALMELCCRVSETKKMVGCFMFAR